MSLHRYFKISVDLRLVLALLHDGHSTRLVYVQTAKGITEEIVFTGFFWGDGERLPAYRDSWATVLSEEMPCLREVGTWVNFSLTWRLGGEAWHSKAWSIIAVSCLSENKNCENFLWSKYSIFAKFCTSENFPLYSNWSQHEPWERIHAVKGRVISRWVYRVRV